MAERSLDLETALEQAGKTQEDLDRKDLLPQGPVRDLPGAFRLRATEEDPGDLSVNGHGPIRSDSWGGCLVQHQNRGRSGDEPRAFRERSRGSQALSTFHQFEVFSSGGNADRLDAPDRVFQQGESLGSPSLSIRNSCLRFLESGRGLFRLSRIGAKDSPDSPLTRAIETSCSISPMS